MKTNCRFENFKAEVKIIHYILLIKVVNEQIPKEKYKQQAFIIISLQFLLLNNTYFFSVKITLHLFLLLL